MSIEARPERRPRRAGDRWRGPLGFVVSIAIHTGLGTMLMMFVASSEPESGSRPNVPIDFIQRHSHADSGDDRTTAFKAEPTLPRGSSPGADRRVPKPRQRTLPDQPPVAESPAPAVLNGVAMQRAEDVLYQAAEPAVETGTGVGAQSAATPIDGSADSSDSGNGAAVGGRTGGGPAGNATDNASKDRDTKIAYALDVRRALERRGAYPGTARRLGLEGEVEMLLKIDGSGTLVEIRVTTSSGYLQLDEAALASARRIGPLPPPPGGAPVEIMVPVSFSMRRN